MFKPGEIARVNGSGEIVTILPETSCLSGSNIHKWPVMTSGGIFNETDLTPAHLTVLATANARDLSSEAFREYMHSANQVKVTGMPSVLLEKLKKILGKASLDYNGHWKDGSALRSSEDKSFNVLKKLFIGPRSMETEDAEDLICAIDATMPLDRWVGIDLTASLTMTLGACTYCGENQFNAETNGSVVRIVGKACEFSTGMPLTEFELNVPSGKLVIANDLRKIFPIAEDEGPNINTLIGCRKTALMYAGNGLASAFVGNSSPGVYKCGNDFKIANPPENEIWNGTQYTRIVPTPKFKGKAVAQICTDLWWYCICDEAEFKRRCKYFKQKTSNLNIQTINVKPGVYRFLHDEEAVKKTGPEEIIYTRFQWVGEPHPVKDFLAYYKEVNVNAHAYVVATVDRWPTLYGDTVPWSGMTPEQKLNSWQKVANDIFCVIGGGIDWHEKGFPQAKVDPDVLDTDPPEFRSQFNWYPFSKPYGGLFEPKTLSGSFARLAFRVLESIISFGNVVRDGEHSREVPYVRQRMMVSVNRYRELAALYPESADPKYRAWLDQEDRAESWVRNFPLGPVFTEKHRLNILRQRWIPEDAYAIAFDARKLEKGNFAWHPKNGGSWAGKKDAQRYAVMAWEDNEQPAEHNCFWNIHATNTSVPLYCVARVVKVGEVSHTGDTLVEITFDYGTPWMLSPKRKAVAEFKEKDAINVLTKKEYHALLPQAIEFFKKS